MSALQQPGEVVAQALLVEGHVDDRPQRLPGRVATSGGEVEKDYTGHHRDESTQLHYAGASYYMSALGRWTTTDPLLSGSPAGLVEDGKLHYQGASPYNYTFNNPTNLTDPTGIAACPPDCDFQSVVGGFWNYTVNRVKTAFNDAEHAATHPKETLDAAIQEQREGNLKSFNEDATRLADGVSDLSTGAAVVGLAGAPFTGGSSLSLTGYALTAGSVADATSLGLKTYDVAAGDGSASAALRQGTKVLLNVGGGRIIRSLSSKVAVRTGPNVVGPEFYSPATGRFVTNRLGYSVNAAADAAKVGLTVLAPEEQIFPDDDQ